MSKLWLVYKHTNTLTNKSYVGITCTSFAQRWRSHKCSARKGSQTHFHLAIRKYGEDIWESSILEDNIKSAELAESREKDWIHTYDTYNKGYNSTLGGSYIPQHNQDNRRTRKASFYNVKTKEEVHDVFVVELAAKYSLEAKHLYSVASGKLLSWKNWRLLENKEYTKKLSKEHINKIVTKNLGKKRSEYSKNNIRRAILKNSAKYTFYNRVTGVLVENIHVVQMCSDFNIGSGLYSIVSAPKDKKGFTRTFLDWCVVETTIENLNFKQKDTFTFINNNLTLKEVDVTAAYMRDKYGLDINRIRDVGKGLRNICKGWSKENVIDMAMQLVQSQQGSVAGPIQNAGLAGSQI